MFLPPRPLADLQTCFVCDRPATTVEHVIPRWLQHRFNLWDQELTLPNGTSIPYRRLQIPACRTCNVDAYGVLERRVERDQASGSDIWMWANKIHYGLMHKDRLLAWDRKDQSIKIGDVATAQDPIERSRNFLRCLTGEFKTFPGPFGSVFSFRFLRVEPFAFAHFTDSSSVCICLGNVGHVVFVEDGQTTQDDRSTHELLALVPSPPRLADMLFFYAQCLEQAARHSATFPFFMGPGMLARTGGLAVRSVEPPNKARFRRTCSRLGLHWIDTEPD